MLKRPLCFVCLLFLVIQSVVLMVKSGNSLVEIPASSIFCNTNEETVLVRGQVYKKTHTSNSQILYLKNNSVNAEHLLIYDREFQNIPIGKTIEIQGKRTFFERARNPGNFDQALYYARQNIYGAVHCEKILLVSGEEHALMEWLYQLKMAWRKSLVNCMGEKNGGILAAMILGEKSEMDSNVKELYQNNGISHILAISGLHISFIGLGLYRIIRKSGLGFLPSGIFAMIILTLYVMMIGPSVSAVRAYVMLLLKIGADITGRVYDMLTAAMLAAAITVLYQPLYLTDGGFYMSYGAILGITLVLPFLKECFRCRYKCLSGFHTSIAINIMVFPITLWFFYVVPTYSVFLNMLVLPLTAPILGIGIVGSVLLLWSPLLGEFCLRTCGLTLEFYDWICRGGNRLPYSRLVFGKPEIWKMILYYTVLFLTLFVVSYAKKKKWKCTIYRYAWFLLILVIGIMTYRQNGTLAVTMLDVGQGDGIYMRGPMGTTYFIDGGSSDESGLGKYSIEPFLESQGIGELDYVFITHGDSDHYNGIEEMLGRQDVGVAIDNLVLPMYYRQDQSLMELAKKANEAQVNVLLIKEGDVLQDGGMKIVCLQPAEDDRELTGNAGSMVLEVEYGAFSMLFTGDVEGEGEECLLKKIKGKNYDVLKVAHHGSRNSTSKKFLELSSPDIALISSGEDNRYGHPHKELVERLENVGCDIYNTQENGAIMLETDGNLYYSIREYVKKGEHK